MTDRSLRYVVEIDASSAADAIQRIKASLSSEITGAGSTGNGSAAAGMKQAAAASAEIEQNLKAAAAAEKELSIIAAALEDVDLFGDLPQQIKTANSEMRRLEKELDDLKFTINPDFTLWEKQQETAKRAASAKSINLRTQDLIDYERNPAAYDRPAPSRIKDIESISSERVRETIDLQYKIAMEQIRLASLEDAGDDAMQRLAAKARQFDELWTDEAARADAERARRAEVSSAKKAGQLIPPKGAADGTGKAYTQQAAITVSKQSADNAKRLADELERASTFEERIRSASTERDKQTIAMRQQLAQEQAQQYAAQAAAEDLRLQQIRARTADRGAKSQAYSDDSRVKAETAAQIEEQKRLTAATVGEVRTRTTAAVEGSRQQTAAAKAAAAQQIAAAEQQTGQQRMQNAAAVIAAKAVATAGTNALVQQQTRTTLAAKAAAQEQIEAQKRLTAVTTQEAKERTARVIQEQKRETAALKAQLKDQTAARRESASMSLPSAASALYIAQEISQYAQRGYEIGRTGAQQLRQLETFSAITARAGINASQLIAAVKAASKGTVTEIDAVTLSTNVLARKFSDSRENIVADIAQLVGASRRLSQVYTDENGAFLTTRDVFARLVKYIGEGNKELVDQFGISNARIAESLGTTVQGLASAAGAGQRFQGLLQVLAEDQARFGEASIGAADKIEASEARITDAYTRIQQAAAGPTAAIATTGADWLEILLKPLDSNVLQRRIQDRLDLAANDPEAKLRFAAEVTLKAATGNPLNETAEAARLAAGLADPATRAGLEQLKTLIGGISSAAAAGDIAATAYMESLTDIATVLIDDPGRYAEFAYEVDRIAKAYEFSINPANRYAEAQKAINELAAALPDDAGAAQKQLAGLVDMYADGLITADQFNGMLGAQIDLLARIAGEAGIAAGAVGDFVSNLSGISGNAALIAGIFGGQYDNIDTQRANRSPRFGDPLDQFKALRNQDRELKRQATEEAIKENQRAAEKAANAFEAAAERAAAAFESSLKAVPGLFGTSSVTESQMKLAAAGVPQNFADDYLRRLSDEVLNKDAPDYADVDIYDAAKRAGIDGSLPKEAILELFRAAWEDSSLFAGGANTDLINQSAVQAELARGEKSAAGEEALKALFGIESDDVTSAAAGARAEFDAAFYGDPAAAGEGKAGSNTYVSDLSAAISQDLTGGDTAKRLSDAGAALVNTIHAGFTTAISSLEWGSQIIDSIAAAVAGPVFDMLKEQFNP